MNITVKRGFSFFACGLLASVVFWNYGRFKSGAAPNTADIQPNSDWAELLSVDEVARAMKESESITGCALPGSSHGV